MLTYTIIISIPMIVIAVFLYYKVYNMIVADSIRSEQLKSAQTAPLLEEVLEEIPSCLSQIQELPLYKNFMDDPEAFLMNDSLSSDSAKVFSSSVQTLLEDAFPNVLRIYVDLPAERLLPLSEGSDGIIAPLSSLSSIYWKGIFAGSNITELYCPSLYLSSAERNQYGDMAYIQKNEIYVSGEWHICYTALYCPTEPLKQILNNALPVDGSVSYIMNERDSIVTTTDRSLSGIYYLNYDTLQNYFLSSNNFLQKEVLGEEIYAGIYNIRQAKWYMIVVIPQAPLIHQSNLIMAQYVLLFLLCIIVAIVIAITMSHSITKRIAMVSGQMAHIRTGPPTPLSKPEIHDEIGNLIDTYNYMCTILNHLIWEQAKSAEELRISEFNSLQAQINPHFLYNTMDMINWMATQGQTAKIVDVVQSLSRFYKLTLSKRETISTLEDEIEHVSLYIKIQNMRFHDAINFVVDIPDELLEYPIPKLTLQPVVENAILHGIMEKEDKCGSIVLTGWTEGETIELLVSDNGVGIPEDRLTNILSGEGTSKTGSNIAIYNTHHRLQILFGNSYGLSYQSTPGCGTDVSIRLPYCKYNEQPANNTLPAKSYLDSRSLQAIELLQQPDVNVYNVAIACGYSDAAEFFKDFQEQFHISPEDYHKEFGS